MQTFYVLSYKEEICDDEFQLPAFNKKEGINNVVFEAKL